jgi:ketosteroid isomerase-like protein
LPNKITRPDPQIAQLIVALTLQYEEAFNEHDAKAAAAFFTEDAVWTTPQWDILWSQCD